MGILELLYKAVFQFLIGKIGAHIKRTQQSAQFIVSIPHR